MTHIEKHGRIIPFPVYHFSCPECGCTFVSNEYNIHTDTIQRWEPSGKSITAFSVHTMQMVCPDCQYLISVGENR